MFKCKYRKVDIILRVMQAETSAYNCDITVILIKCNGKKTN